MILCGLPQMLTPENLISRMLEYGATVDEDLIRKAYVFALDKHGTQIRESGEPFFSHPLEVAAILIDLRMDQTTIIGGILHDTIEDTDTTAEKIEEEFGSAVANIVNGVTKLSKFEALSFEDKQSENFRRLLLAASSDIRILLIKLADRLHNMRTIGYKKKKSKKEKIAKETIEIYGPIAERIGMYDIKNELQNLAFSELHTEIYDAINSRLDKLHSSSEEIIATIIEKLKTIAQNIDLSCTICGRLKSPYSIWTKMNVKNMSFEQLSDIIAFRIVVDSLPECYKILGAIHKEYLIIPRRFRDYISTPKVNGYQSLHTGVIGPMNKRIEIQIRTKEMDLISQYGIAAHWEYKELGAVKTKKNEYEYEWIKNMLHILENTSGIEEFCKNSKIEMFSNQVFCLTPNGIVVSLPSGASALDFAYSIHSEIGDHSTFAKINGTITDLKTIIENGDQIEIITNKNSMPKFAWENYVVTLKAKNSIKKALNSITKEKNEMIGRKSINEFFEKHKLDSSAGCIKKIALHFNFDESEQLFHELGSGSINIRDIFAAYNQIMKKPITEFPKNSYNKYCPINKAMHIASIPDMPISPVFCCFQVPGDKIIGLLLPSNNMEIHIEGCEKLQRYDQNLQKIDLSWKQSAFSPDLKYPTYIFVNINSNPGNLAKISNIIEERNVNIISLKIGEKIENFVELKIGIEVANISELTLLISSLRRADFVNKVSRQNIS